MKTPPVPYFFVLFALVGLIEGCFCLPGPRPLGLYKERVVTGERFLCKETFFEQNKDADPQMGSIYIIGKVKAGETGAETIAISAPHRQLWFIDPQTRNARLVGTMGGWVPLDVEGDGILESMSRGGGFSDVGLFDSTGKLLWKRSGGYETKSTAHWMSAADLDGNGEAEFLVAATDGLYCLDARGLEIWKVGGGDCWHVEVYESDTHGEPLLVSLVAPRQGSKRLEFRDHRGALIRQVCVPGMSSDFRLLKWPTDSERFRILARSGRTVGVLDEKGVLVWKHKLPWSFGGGYGVEGILIRFLETEQPYLAVILGTRVSWNRSLLCVFTLAGELMYQEVIPKAVGLVGIRLNETGAPTGETLLVSENRGRIVAYQRR